MSISKPGSRKLRGYSKWQRIVRCFYKRKITYLYEDECLKCGSETCTGHCFGNQTTEEGDAAELDRISRATRDAAEKFTADAAGVKPPEGFVPYPPDYADREMSDAEQRSLDWEEREMYYRDETEL